MIIFAFHHLFKLKAVQICYQRTAGAQIYTLKPISFANSKSETHSAPHLWQFVTKFSAKKGVVCAILLIGSYRFYYHFYFRFFETFRIFTNFTLLY